MINLIAKTHTQGPVNSRESYGWAVFLMRTDNVCKPLRGNSTI